MVFSSLIFLYGFLPICMLVYLFAGSQRTKNLTLLIFSLFFYAWGEPIWVLLMIATGLFIYWAGLKMDRSRENPAKARLYLILTITAALSSLAVFKYSGFLIANLNYLPGLALPVPRFTLPIGISFYTFQTLTYAIDLYRGKANVQRSFINFLLYVSLFPQLIAGPIVRYTDIADQIDSRTVSVDDFAQGIQRFLIGLGKKVLIANHAGEIATQTIGSRLQQLSTTEAWIGLIAFAIQIYFDFSGYSDMAIGLGRMFGFRFHENFRYPYISTSITDFWRRWHISLSTFFRDYVYIPLGGNRHRQIRNMFLVWALTGLWHGASWNFVFWGLYFFLLLLLEKTVLRKVLDKLPRPFGHLYTMLAVLLGWVFFYFTGTADLFTMLAKMFGTGSTLFFNVRAEILVKNEILFLLTAMLLSTPFLKQVFARWSERMMSRSSGSVTVGAVIGNLLLLFLSTAVLVGSTFNPFLYFRF